MVLLPFPSLEESVASLPLSYLFLHNGWIGSELKYKFTYSPFGKMWTYHAYQLATYALLLQERADKIPVSFYDHWWSRDKNEQGIWRFPKKFFLRYLKKDTGLPEWVGNPSLHESHQQVLSSPPGRLPPPPVPEINLRQRLKNLRAPK